MVQQAFHHVEESMRLTFRRLLVTLAALLLPGWVAAQEPVTVSGTVTTQDGAPISDASVLIPELSLGATTRSDGKYAVLIPGARAQGQQVTVLEIGRAHV